MSASGLAPLPDGGTLAFEVRGSGPALLLLRPVGGSLLSWGRFADALAQKAQVIAFDARGTGASSQAPPGATTRQMAAEARALLDHLSIARAHVFGLSLGGMVASWLAIDAPERVDRLILASTLPRGLAIHATVLFRALTLARCLARAPAEAEACLATQILSKQFRRDHPDEVAQVQRLARLRPASHRGLLTMLQAAARHDVRERLPDIRAQTLGLVGERDPLLTLGSQRALLSRIPSASFEVIPGAGHDLSTESPRYCAERILQFISGAVARLEDPPSVA